MDHTISVLNSKLNNDKNILLIGNSPNVKDKELGKIINSEYFNIFRFNKQVIHGYEKYIGYETSFRVVNGFTWVNNNNQIPEDNIIIAEPPNSPFYQKIFSTKIEKKFKSISRINDYTKNYTDIFPTSGFMSISFLLQFYDLIYIYGFSYEGTHFYDNSKGAPHHKYSIEKKIIQSLIRHGKIIYLNEKIIFPLSPIIINPNINISKLKTTVLCTDHKLNNHKFNYIHFNRQDIDLPRGKTIYVQACINNKKIFMVLWGYPNHLFNINTDYDNTNFDLDYDLRGNSHGKDLLENFKFQIASNIDIIKTLPLINILSLKHNHGDKEFAKFFHFNLIDIKQFLKNKSSNTIDIKVIHPIKKNQKDIIIWSNNNGGTLGDSHGRYKHNPKAGDFLKCTFLIVTEIFN